MVKKKVEDKPSLKVSTSSNCSGRGIVSVRKTVVCTPAFFYCLRMRMLKEGC